MEEIVADFTRLELDNNLFDKKIHSMKFWSYVRFSIFWSYNSEELLDEPDCSKFYLALKYTLSFFQGLANFHKFSNKKYDLLCINTSRRTNQIDNKEVDIYTYPLIKQLNKNYNILLIDISKFENSKDYPCDFLPMRFGQIFIRFLRSFYKFSKKDKNHLSNLETDLNKIFQKEIKASQIIMKEIIRHKIEFKLYRIIFKIFSPKILFYTNNGVMGGIIEAAKDLGIKTVELQHGGISHLHIAYNSTKFNKRIIPNFIFTFGEYWHDAIKFETEKISVGFPYMELIENSLPKNICRKENAILVISNGRFGRNFLVEVTNNILSSWEGCEVYYKLKASEYANWKDKYPTSFQNKHNLIIIDNNDKPLNYFYKKAKYLIGSGSTCIYEGVANDMIVFAITSLYFSDAKKLIGSNSLFIASNAQEILAKIKDQEVPLGKIKKGYMFKTGTYENITKHVQEILLK